MCTELVMLYNPLILCHPIFLLPSIFPSIRDFSGESTLNIRWPKHWSFSVSPSNECSGLIYFRIDCFHFPAVQGALKTKVFSSPMIQKHSFFLALSLLYGPTLTSVHDYWKNHSFDSIWTFVGKVMSLFLMIAQVFSLNQSWTDHTEGCLKGRELLKHYWLSIQMEVPCLHHIHAHCEAPPMTRSMNISQDPIQAISRKINKDWILLERKKCSKLKPVYISSNGRSLVLFRIVTGNIGERISNDNNIGKNDINKEVIEGLLCLSSIRTALLPKWLKKQSINISQDVFWRNGEAIMSYVLTDVRKVNHGLSLETYFTEFLCITVDG